MRAGTGRISAVRREPNRLCQNDRNRPAAAPRAGRPPAGAKEREKVKDYPQLSVRVPNEFKARLNALSAVTGLAQWRVIVEAIDCFMSDLLGTDRELVDGLSERLMRTRRVRGRSPVRAPLEAQPHREHLSASRPSVTIFVMPLRLRRVLLDSLKKLLKILTFFDRAGTSSAVTQRELRSALRVTIRKAQGFALIDLIFVCGIIGLLCTIALPRLLLAQAGGGVGIGDRLDARDQQRASSRLR